MLIIHTNPIGALVVSGNEAHYLALGLPDEVHKYS